jgi:glycosyltransferase involved in cell wall biosynthesis
MKPETLIQSILSPQRSELYFKPHISEKFNPSTQKIAILATNEFEGFSKNGGIGTYYTALSQKLAAENWCIILLLCQSHENVQAIPKPPNIHHVFSVSEVESVLQLQPIHQAILSNTQKDSISQSFDYDSFCCLFLTQAIVATFPQAVVYIEFPAIWGFGYRTIQAKKSGVLGNSCLVGVTDHGGFEWLRETNRRYNIEYPQWFWQACHYEQYSYENADITYFPSHFLKSKVESYGWKTSHVVHLPYFIPILKSLTPDKQQDNSQTRIKQITQLNAEQISLVFFGRLEERKGLCTFVEALQLLDPNITEKIKIFFLGKIVQLESTQLKGLESQQYIDHHLQGKFSYQILPDLSSLEAIELVDKLPNPIVCLCSNQENFPNAALEMGQLPVSLVVSNTGGFQETLNLISRTEGLRWFQPEDSYSLAGCIGEAILANPETPVTPDISFLEQTNQNLLNQRLEFMSEAFLKSTPKPVKNPRVTIGVIGFHESQKLLDCLESLAGQTYQNLEVIILSETSADITLPQEQFPNYRFIEFNINQSLGTAYNHLVEFATGDYFLPFSSHCIALPDMIEKFVTAVNESEAVVVVSPEMKLDNNIEIFNANDGSLLKLLEFNQSRDLCALFSIEFLREFPYCEVRELQGLNWQILAAAIATDQTIAYYPYPLYLSDSNSTRIIKPEQLPKERYYLRQYLSQIKPEKWTQRQLHLLLTCIEQLSQLQTERQGQLWQLHQEKSRYQALASQSQAWMQTALETQKELDALQAELEKTQAIGNRQVT